MHVTLTDPLANSSAMLTSRDVEIFKSGTALRINKKIFNNVGSQNYSDIVKHFSREISSICNAQISNQNLHKHCIQKSLARKKSTQTITQLIGYQGFQCDSQFVLTFSQTLKATSWYRPK